MVQAILMMRRTVLAGALLAALAAGPAWAADNYVVKDANGNSVTIGAKDIGSGVESPKVQPSDGSGATVTAIVGAATAPASISGVPGCIYNSSAPSLTTGQSVAAQCTAAGQAIVSPLGQGATAAAPPANAAALGAVGSGATGGLLTGVKTCDLHAVYDASDNGSKTLVTGVSGRKVYVCGYILATGGTATNLKLVEGSNADCAANAANLTPAWQLVANDKIGGKSAFWDGMAVSTAAYYVCVNASAGNAHQAEIWYTIQ